MPRVGDDGEEHHTYEERAIYRATMLATYFVKNGDHDAARLACYLGARISGEGGNAADFADAITGGSGESR